MAKVLQGGAEGELLARLKRQLATVRHVKPKASRADSAELYLLATGLRGAGGWSSPVTDASSDLGLALGHSNSRSNALHKMPCT